MCSPSPLPSLRTVWHAGWYAHLHRYRLWGQFAILSLYNLYFCYPYVVLKNQYFLDQPLAHQRTDASGKWIKVTSARIWYTNCYTKISCSTHCTVHRSSRRLLHQEQLLYHGTVHRSSRRLCYTKSSCSIPTARCTAHSVGCYTKNSCSIPTARCIAYRAGWYTKSSCSTHGTVHRSARRLLHQEQLLYTHGTVHRSARQLLH